MTFILLGIFIVAVLVVLGQKFPPFAALPALVAGNSVWLDSSSAVKIRGMWEAWRLRLRWTRKTGGERKRIGACP